MEDEVPLARRRRQAANRDWVITTPQSSGSTNIRLLPSNGGRVVRVVCEGCERTSPKCTRRKT